MTERFHVYKSTDHGAKPVWNILDTTATTQHFHGPYTLRRQARVQADRWNVDHNLALVETGRITREEYVSRCEREGRQPVG